MTVFFSVSMNRVCVGDSRKNANLLLQDARQRVPSVHPLPASLSVLQRYIHRMRKDLQILVSNKIQSHAKPEVSSVLLTAALLRLRCIKLAQEVRMKGEFVKSFSCAFAVKISV